MALGVLCNLKAGKAIPRDQISEHKSGQFIFPCYGGNGLRGYVRMSNLSGNYPLIGRQGALCGNICFASGDFYATEHAVVVDTKGRCDEKFLYYLLQSMNLNQYKTAGAQPGLSVARLETIPVPVPSLPEQHRIVSILERFNTLCNDLTSNIPAEIEARRKQYEYYLNALLTFKELGA